MKYGKLGSSQNSDKLALRVKTIMLALIPVAIYFSGLAGYNIGEETWQQLVELVVDLITYATLLFAVAGHIWGWYRAIK